MSQLLSRLVIGLAGSIALLFIWRRTAELGDESEERPGRPPPPPDRWEASDPATIRGVLKEATQSRFGADFRLRPLLRQVAADRLRHRHGIDVDDPAAAVLLGPSAWTFLRPDRPIVRDFRAPGLPVAQIEEIVDAVERL